MNSDVHELGGRDPYVMLGLERGAGRDEVTRAFRRNAANGGHPDTGGDSQTFRQLTRARDILLDERRLANYDTTRQDPVVGGETFATIRPEPAPSSFTSAEPDVPAKLNALTIVTLMLAFLGPLAWPAALVSGHVALWRLKRSGQRGHSFLYVAMAFLHVASVIVLPGLLTIAIVSIA